MLFDSRFGLFSCPAHEFAQIYTWAVHDVGIRSPPPWWERVLRWPAVGLYTLGLLLALAAGRVIYSLL